MEAILQKICNNMRVNNSLLTRDWDAMPVPTLPREGKSTLKCTQSLVMASDKHQISFLTSNQDVVAFVCYQTKVTEIGNLPKFI